MYLKVVSQALAVDTQVPLTNPFIPSSMIQEDTKADQKEEETIKDLKSQW